MKFRSPICNFIATIALTAFACMGQKALATDSFFPIEANDPLAKSVVRIELPGDLGSAGTCSGTFSDTIPFSPKPTVSTARNAPTE